MKYNQYSGAYGYPQAQYPYTGAPTAQGPYGNGGYGGYGGYGGFPGMAPQTPGTAPKAPTSPGMLPMEESYIENILRLNKGRVATVYMSFENEAEWSAKVFRGVIEAAGRDHIILSDPQTGRRYVLLMIYLDYVTFDEEIEYEYPLAASPTNG